MDPHDVIVCFIFSVLFTTAAAGTPSPSSENSKCMTKCQKLFDINLFQASGKILRHHIIQCTTEGYARDEIALCNLDLWDVFKDIPPDFVATAAVSIKCDFPARVTLYNQKGLKLKTMAVFEVRHCGVHWSDLVTFGKCVELRLLRFHQPLYVTNDLASYDLDPVSIPLHHLFPPRRNFDRDAYKNWKMVRGLHTLSWLEIRNPLPCHQNDTTPHCTEVGQQHVRDVNIPDVFQKYVWPELAELILKNMALTSDDILPLPRSIPFLQSFKVYHNNASFVTFPKFPWCSENVLLPHGLSRAESGLINNKYTAGANIPRNMHRRFLNISFAFPSPAIPLDFDGALDAIDLKNTVLDFGANPPSPFQGAYGLQILILPNNQIRSLPDHAFRGNSHIREIDLTNNSIETIGQDVFKGHKVLRILSLAMNRISELDSKLFNDTINLLSLDLSFNKLSRIRTGTFITMTKLQVLDLANNFIQTFESGAVPSYESNRLMRLNLSNNRLKTLHSDILLFRFALHIDLSNNKITSGAFAQVFRTLDADVISDVMEESPNQTDYEGLLFASRGKVIVLSLVNNSIDNIDVGSMNESVRSAFVTYLSYYKIDLRGNPINCDCSAYSWTELIKENKKFNEWDSYSWRFFARDHWRCVVPLHLQGRPVGEIREEEFQCPFSGPFCPGPCECFDMKSGHVTLVHCDNRNLTTLPELMPPGQLELHLEDNKLESIPPRPYLQNVTGLYVQRNYIRNLTSEVILLLKNAKRIYLQNNNISRISEKVTQLDLAELDLGDNSLVCDCKSRWMVSWLRNSTFILNQKDVLCTTSRTTTQVFLISPKTLQCKGSGVIFKLVGGVCAGFFILVICIAVVVVPVMKKLCKSEAPKGTKRRKGILTTEL